MKFCVVYLVNVCVLDTVRAHLICPGLCVLELRMIKERINADKTIGKDIERHTCIHQLY